MSRNRYRSDGSGASLLAILVVVAVLWWLRWIILVALIGTVIAVSARWLLRRQARHRAAERVRLDAIRNRAEIQNAQVVRGDPAGFFGQYPLPDPELIPAWYKSA